MTYAPDPFERLHPAVIRALQQVVEDSHSQGVPVGICGELAGDPAAVLLLMAMGFDSLSMNATNLLRVKSVIRGVKFADAQSLLAEVKQLPDTESINRRIEAAYREAGLTWLTKPSMPGQKKS